MSRARRIACGFAAIVLGPGSVLAAEFPCNEALWPSMTSDELGAMAGAGLNQTAPERCAAGSDGEGALYCRWRFALRHGDADTLAEELDRRLAHCHSREEDTGVNHPDMSKIVTFRAAKRRIVLSYKDKSALGATFVTLRVFFNVD